MMKTVWHWRKTYRSTEQNLEVRNSYVYGKLIFNKNAEPFNWGKG